MRAVLLVPVVVCVGWVSVDALGAPVEIPDDFPRFIVPGHEKSMASMRELHCLHYKLNPGPLATLWDEWISGPTLWPAVTSGNMMAQRRQRWAEVLSGRIIDPDGYVATHQHVSIAHQHGWPFPFWAQGGEGTWGWHFSLQNIAHGWHGTIEKTQEGWELTGGKDLGIADHAWNIEMTGGSTVVRTPPVSIQPDQSPFIQLRWRASGLIDARPYLEWTTEAEPEFGPQRRYPFDAITDQQGMVYTMIPVFKSPQWKGRITRLGLNFGNAKGATIGVQALFTQYDTRHNINNPCYIRGCCQYFWWTGDVEFLRKNITRMRLALHYAMEDLGGLREKCIVTPYVGHDGRSGIERTADGKKIIHPGRGIGNNYWDLLPMGHKDAYATIHYYDTLEYMARLEREIAAHPEWSLPKGPYRQSPEKLLAHAAEVKVFAGPLFWNEATGRFICGLDVDGNFYDFGYTFVNCEAIYYDFATPAQAESIMSWLTGERIVEGDTSQGADIYHWRFGPRASTKRNIEWYGWYWPNPETIIFGDQVQDGGAVLGFSFHDLMSRLKVRGPDDAWKRLQGLIAWFDEVQAGGGYREYYKDGTRGKLQGGGPPGGLGMDREFFESILVPEIVIRGFLGFEPRVDGFAIEPRLPTDWPELTVDRIAWQDCVVSVTASAERIVVQGERVEPTRLRVYPPVGQWTVTQVDASGRAAGERSVRIGKAEESVPVLIENGTRTELVKE